MGSIEFAASALGGVIGGLMVVYAAARLIATAWFKTKKEFSKEQDDDGVSVQAPERKERRQARFAVG